MLKLARKVPSPGADAEPRRVAQDGPHEELWLLGLPPLWRLLEFVDEFGIKGEADSPAALTKAWGIANDYYQELERREPGVANRTEVMPLDPRLAALSRRLQQQPEFRRTFDSLPTSIGMVPLDLLIVYQRHVTGTFVDRLVAGLRELPRQPEALFRFCFPFDHPKPAVEVRNLGSRRYLFRSESTDFRLHEPVLLRPEQILEHEASGTVASALALMVGFGSNCLNVVRVGARLLLCNGYHRACAMRLLGITHAPCIIQDAVRTEELALAAPSEAVEEAEFYFESARPPLLKDFFDARIRKKLAVRPRARYIEVSFDIKESQVAE